MKIYKAIVIKTGVKILVSPNNKGMYVSKDKVTFKPNELKF